MGRWFESSRGYQTSLLNLKLATVGDARSSADADVHTLASPVRLALP